MGLFVFSIENESQRNGRKVIKQAPTLRGDQEKEADWITMYNHYISFLADYYTSHIGRVSPKIKDLQEQLRQAQYRSFTDDSL